MVAGVDFQSGGQPLTHGLIRIRRYLITAFQSVLFTLFLLFLMFQLIRMDDPGLLPKIDFRLPPITGSVEEEAPLVMVAKPPAPKHAQLPPELPATEKINLSETAVETSWGEPGFEMDSPNELATPENQLVLVLGYPPEYPRRALPLNIEGYVVVGFSVDKAGQVFDARVLESSPAKVFDRAALRAIAKFRYKPRVVGGKAVVTADQRYKFVFELSD